MILYNYEEFICKLRIVIFLLIVLIVLMLYGYVVEKGRWKGVNEDGRYIGNIMLCMCKDVCFLEFCLKVEIGLG